mmetsp:Transcript_9116/g.21448  ORF Transcript_9116/g.21448 Transcript_9116/m.21448 type:complete len:200 (-) Transcript_9116:440-1039(-)
MVRRNMGCDEELAVAIRKRCAELISSFDPSPPVGSSPVCGTAATELWNLSMKDSMIEWRTSISNGFILRNGHRRRLSSVHVRCRREPSGGSAPLGEYLSNSEVDRMKRTPGCSSVGNQCIVSAAALSPSSLLTPSSTITMRAGTCFFAAEERKRESDQRRRSSDLGTSMRSLSSSFRADSRRKSRWLSCLLLGEHPTKC